MEKCGKKQKELFKIVQDQLQCYTQRMSSVEERSGYIEHMRLKEERRRKIVLDVTGENVENEKF